jgi:hypothetical protein
MGFAAICFHDVLRFIEPNLWRDCGYFAFAGNQQILHIESAFEISKDFNNSKS